MQKIKKQKMNYKILILGISAALFCSCKEEKQDKPEVKTSAPVETFDVALEAIIKQDDSLQLFYRDETMPDYLEQNSVWTAVKGSKESQTVKFNLPEDILPEHIRLDFGQNKKQDPIEVKGFSMEYFGKVFQVKDTMFYQYFMPNEQIEWDRKNGIAKPAIKEGKVYDPFFFPRETLILEINKLTKQ